MQFENKRLVTKLVMPKKDFGLMLLNVKNKYPKFIKHFLDKYRNETFDILSIFSSMVSLQAMINLKNEDIKFVTNITYDKDNYYIRFILSKFYNDITTTKMDQEEIINNFDPNEKEMLDGATELIPNQEDFERIVKEFLKYSFNLNDAIKEYKENTKKGIKYKKSLDEIILFYIFGKFSNSVKQNESLKDPIFKEENIWKN